MRLRLRGTLGRTFSSLRVRNFRLFFIGQTVSNTGNWLTNIALTLLILKLTDSGLAVGLLTTCQYGPILLLSVWAGAIADRRDKRSLLFITQGGEMAQSIALAVLAFQPHPPVAALYVVAALGGMLLAFDNPLRRSFVSEMVPPEEVPNAVVLYSTIVNVSRLIGPALAGLLVVTVGFGWCFTIDALSYVVVLVALWMMRPAELRRLPPKPRAKGEVREAIRYAAATPSLWISFVMLGVVGTLSYNFNVTLPLFVTRGLHESDGWFTVAYSMFSVGAVLAALVVANRNLVKVQHVIVGSALLGVAMLGLALSPTMGIALVAAFAVGATSILYMTATTTIVQTDSDPSMHGRLLALQTVLLVGTAPLGGPLLGWLADVAGPRVPIILGAVACVAVAIWANWALRRRRSRGVESEVAAMSVAG